jgi:molecular chaperone HtpG
MFAEIPLARWLREHGPAYFYKAEELRTEVTRWLTYVPATFQHYTSHAIDHSEEIVLQISNLVFPSSPRTEPTIALSPVEAYILIAAAHLHDAGMVTSEAEKARMLESDEWKAWARAPANASRIMAVEQFRSNSGTADPTLTQYLVDLQLRYLLAEWIRREHHERSGAIVLRHQRDLGRFAFDDLQLATAIADVCVGHGLWHRQLIDDERYPEERDIRGQKANLRLLVILLRLGDLLDLRQSRACPLVMSAASPLPEESVPHWGQYSRITHRLTTPERVEITARCETIAEHRVLRDWCRWIVDEVDDARRTMARAKRHAGWIPPTATMSGDAPTIRIIPSQAAAYVAVDWTFQLDPDAVFQRLIRDVYNFKLAFLRELVQNALDASRCRMFDQLIRRGEALPTSPSALDAALREEHRVVVRLRRVEYVNAMSQTRDTRLVVEVLDSGIGMNLRRVQDYLLQVGRSWYSTHDFSDRYPFAPSSQFGIGFLSVFGVSSHVTVDTWMGGSEQPLHLELTGPRNYLLVETRPQERQGTTVSVATSLDISLAEARTFLSEAFPRVEVPIELQADGDTYTHRAETADKYVSRAINGVNGESYEVRAYEIERPDVDGELYVFVRIDASGVERWDSSAPQREGWRRQYPGAHIPELPRSAVCLNGILVRGGGLLHATDAVRLDYRSRSAMPNLSRNRFRLTGSLGQAVEDRWKELLRTHLASRPADRAEDWRYLQRLATQYKLEAFWLDIPNAMPVYVDGKLQLWSMREAMKCESVTLITHTDRYDRNRGANLDQIASQVSGPYVLRSDLDSIGEEYCKALFEGKGVRAIAPLSGATLMSVDWDVAHAPKSPAFGRLSRPVLLRGLQMLELPGASLAARIAVDNHYAYYVINTRHPLGQWIALMRAKEALPEGSLRTAFDALLEHICSACDDEDKGGELQIFVNRWRALTTVDESLKPPTATWKS